MKDKQATEESDDDASDISRELDTDNSPKNIPIAKLGERMRSKRIVINISDTQYPIIEEIAEELGWFIQKTEGRGDWDLWWTDREIEANTLFRMHLFQKINHFPGIYILARKNLLGLSLMAMREHLEQEYDFFPETWVIPMQFSQFRHHYESVEKGRTRTYIVKPEALSQGRGIFLTRNIYDIINGRKYVIQRYLKNPFLIDKLKFDLRIYVLLAGTDPLRLYLYEYGLARFATEEYYYPTNENLNRSYIHLTNYSLNKSNPNYIYNTSEKYMDRGHKRTLTATYDRLRKMGHNVDKLKDQIYSAIVKTVLAGLPSISHQYQYCQPEEYYGNMCFHILGFDVMITDYLKPIVIEVNHTPSFETGTPLDYFVKKGLISDTLRLMRITQKQKKRLFERAKELAKIRLETGKREIYQGKKREKYLLYAQKERDAQEEYLLGRYKKIYPPADYERKAVYERVLQLAIRISRDVNEARKKLMDEERSVPRLPSQKVQSCKYEGKVKVESEVTQENVTSYGREAPCDEERTAGVNERDKYTEEIYTGKYKQYNGKLKYNNKYQKKCEEKDRYNDKYKNKSYIKLKRTIIRRQYPKIPYKKYYLLYKYITETSKPRLKPNSCDSHDNPIPEKKVNFRMKIAKKAPSPCMSQHVVKYTYSVQRFNELMVRLADQYSTSDSLLKSHNLVDNEIFLKIKNKIIQQRASRSGSQIVKDDKDNQDELRKSELCHDSESYPRNGSFVKPKNYHIVEEKCFKSIRISEERKQVSYVVNKQPLILQSTPLVGLASWLSAPTASKLVSISEKSVALTKTSDKPEKCKKRSLL